MFGNLSNVSDSELLRMVLDILAKPGILTAYDATEIAQIDSEFQRRESFSCQTMAQSLGMTN